MCKAGDIIVVEHYKVEGIEVNRHSFIVIEDEPGKIKGICYDFICNVMSSFKNEQHKAEKLSYPGNVLITVDDSVIPNGNSKEGYVKADQFFYFRKDIINYYTIGYLTKEFFDYLIDYINDLNLAPINITDNL